MSRRTEETGAEAALRVKGEVEALMNAVRRKLERELGETQVSWGFVGSMGHVKEILSDLNEFLGEGGSDVE